MVTARWTVPCPSLMYTIQQADWRQISRGFSDNWATYCFCWPAISFHCTVSWKSNIVCNERFEKNNISVMTHWSSLRVEDFLVYVHVKFSCLPLAAEHMQGNIELNWNEFIVNTKYTLYTTSFTTNRGYLFFLLRQFFPSQVLSGFCRFALSQ